jgi:BlaI family penicillinase repressor
MPRPPSTQPTDVELHILDVLWHRGQSTVREVHNALIPKRDRGYSTTLKMIQVMREKGLVDRDDSVRPQLYRAAESRDQTQLKMLDELMQKAFGGSAKKLVMRMLSANRLSANELAEMQQLIDQAKGEGQ